MGGAAALKNLYVGAAGVIWALDALRRRGHAETSLDLAAAVVRCKCPGVPVISQLVQELRRPSTSVKRSVTVPVGRSSRRGLTIRRERSSLQSDSPLPETGSPGAPVCGKVPEVV